MFVERTKTTSGLAAREHLRKRRPAAGRRRETETPRLHPSEHAMDNPIQNLAVVGAGAMGSGIAACSPPGLRRGADRPDGRRSRTRAARVIERQLGVYAPDVIAPAMQRIRMDAGRTACSAQLVIERCRKNWRSSATSSPGSTPCAIRRPSSPSTRPACRSTTSPRPSRAATASSAPTSSRRPM